MTTHKFNVDDVSKEKTKADEDRTAAEKKYKKKDIGGAAGVQNTISFGPPRPTCEGPAYFGGVILYSITTKTTKKKTSSSAAKGLAEAMVDPVGREKALDAVSAKIKQKCPRTCPERTDSHVEIITGIIDTDERSHSEGKKKKKRHYEIVIKAYVKWTYTVTCKPKPEEGGGKE